MGLVVGGPVRNFLSVTFSIFEKKMSHVNFINKPITYNLEGRNFLRPGGPLLRGVGMHREIGLDVLCGP